MNLETNSRLARVFESMMPRSAHEGLIRQIWRDASTKAEFVWKSITTVIAETNSWVWRAFNLERVLAETVVASVPYWGAPPLPAIAVVAVTIAALRIREAMIYPGTGGPSETFADALIVASVMLGSQIVFAFIMPELVIHNGLFLARGVATGVLALPLLRTHFHLNSYRYNPAMARASSVVRGSWRLVVLCFLCLFTLNAVNVETVPDYGHIRDFLIGWFWLPLLLLGYKLQHGTLDKGVFHGSRIDRLGLDSEKEQLLRQRDSLWQPSQTVGVQRLQLFVFFALGYPLPIGLWRWYHGTGIVHWVQVITNTITLILLAFLWREIKKNNARIAKAIDEQLAELERDKTKS